MKKQLLRCVVAAGLLSLPAYSQTATFNWARQIGASSATQVINEGETDSLGNTLLTGSFGGFTDFDPGPGSTVHAPVGSYDAFMARYNSNGDLLWINYFGGSSYDIGRTITQDRWGNVYASGNFTGTIYFNPFTGTPSASSPTLATYIAKFNPSGVLIWARAFTSSGNCQGADITTDAAGNVYLCGHFGGTGDFNPAPQIFSLTANATRDVFICKYDSAGNFITAKQFGPSLPTSTSFNSASQIRFDHAGNMLFSGTFQHTVDFDPNAGTVTRTSAGNDDSFILKLDNNLNYTWVSTFGGPGYDDPTGAMDIDAGNNIIIGGYYEMTVDFDPGPGTLNYTSNGGDDAWISKFDAAGNMVWVKVFGGGGYDYVNDLDTDQNGDIYYTGSFAGAVDMDPNNTVNLQLSLGGTSDCYINKLTASGNLVWSKIFGDGLSSEYGQHIGVDENYTIYSAGRFGSQMDFYPGPGVYNMTAIGAIDIYMHQMTQCLATQAAITATACGTYTAPSGTVYSSSGTYQDTIPNINGCDSMLTITLTINPVTTSSVTAVVCGSFTSPAGNVYSASGTYFDTLVNVIGCDSVITISLTVNSATTSSVSAGVCGSYTSPAGNVYSASGTYFDTLVNVNGCDSVITINLTVNQPSTAAVTDSACGSYTSPAGNVYSTSGTYIDTLVNVFGCDSVITISLTINAPDVTVVNTSPVLTAVQNGATYQWLDCNNAYSVIAGATGQSFTATANGNYAVAVTQGLCTDTSACAGVIGLGLPTASPGNSITLIPNPTNGMFIVKLPSPGKEAVVYIRDITGRVVAQQVTAPNGEALFMLQEPAGLYFVEVTAEGQPLQRIKVIKTN